MWLQLAHEEAVTGISEIPGPKYHPRITEYLSTINGLNQFPLSDETPWCSAFANWCMAQTGADRSHSPLARSWMRVGQTVWQPDTTALSQVPQEGDIAVFFSKQNQINGHVGFYICHSPDRTRVLILGGNQGNRVCYQWYRVNGQTLRLASIRRITL